MKKILSGVFISLGIISPLALASEQDSIQQKKIQERAIDINRINASKLTEVITLNDGTKIFPAGTFPNANNPEKDAECAKDGLINYTPKAVVTLSPDAKDATICIAPTKENMSNSQSRASAYLRPQPHDQYVSANQIFTHEGRATFGNFGINDQGLVQVYVNKNPNCYAGTIVNYTYPPNTVSVRVPNCSASRGNYQKVVSTNLNNQGAVNGYATLFVN